MNGTRLLAVSLLLAAAACGGQATRDYDPAAGGASPGSTPCGSTTCNPGEHCKAPDDCDTGCLDDANCAPGERCSRSDPSDETGSCAF